MNESFQSIVAHVEKSSPELADLMRNQGELKFPEPLPAFAALCRAVIGQQLSVRAAETVWLRFAQAAGDIVPARILNFEMQELRALGLSEAKSRSVHAIADAFLKSPETYAFPANDSRTDTEIATALVAIRGIGPWTAHMFLMFTLRRPDVFAEGDLGIRKAMCQLFNRPDLTPSECLAISEPWAPYRSTVCRHLWASLG